MLPLQILELYNNRNSLFYIIKIVRINKGFKILDEHVIMQSIKQMYKRKVLEKMKNNEKIRQDKENDHNKIEELLIINYTLKITKLVIIILNMSYLFGMFWYIMVFFVSDIGGFGNRCGFDEPNMNNDTFLCYYGLNQTEKSEGFLIATLTYFAFTSLSTVGFGDYAPRSDLERAFGAFMLLSGVAIFSIIMGQFIAILNSYSQFNEENNDGDRLQRFFGVLVQFNKHKQMKKELKEKIEDFFNYRWENDRNMAFIDEHE